MTLINWLGIGFCILIFCIGIPLKIHTRRKIKDFNGYLGIVKKQDIKGDINNILYQAEAEEENAASSLDYTLSPPQKRKV